MPSNHIENYDEQYIEACFFAWYRAGSPGLMTSNGLASAGGTRVLQSIPPNQDGKIPSINTVSKWAQKYAWRSRADVLDAQVAIRLEKEAIDERVKILKELARNGRSLKEKGLKYIENSTDPFEDNPSAAVRAIVAGSEMEFKYAGAADRLAAIGAMSDKQIESQILHLLGKESDEDENSETIDAELEDITSDDEETGSDS